MTKYVMLSDAHSVLTKRNYLPDHKESLINLRRFKHILYVLEPL